MTSASPVAHLAAAAFAIAALAPAQTPAAPERPREAAVLALLRRIPAAHTQIWSTPVAVADSALGSRIVVPSITGLCGTGWNQAFDPKLARQLARDLAAIYGLDMKAEVQAPNGVAAELDGYDAGRKIAFELRGAVENKPTGAGSEWPTVVDEPAAAMLDADEFDALEAAKVRIHVADVNSFWTAASDDRLTTTLCYLASVAHFLNSVTDGEDVVLDGMLSHRGADVQFALPKPQPGLRVVEWSGGVTLTAERAVEVALAFDPKAAGTVANAGTPVAIALHLDGATAAPTIALRQNGADGKPRELATSTTGVLFAPGTFDSTRPFALVLRLQPGEYRLQPPAWISGAPAAKN